MKSQGRSYNIQYFIFAVFTGFFMTLASNAQAAEEEGTQQSVGPIQTTNIQFWVILGTIFFTALAVWIITAAIQRKRNSLNSQTTKDA